MTLIADVMKWMESIAPLRLSAEWDNTGLLLGDAAREARRVMTCLTLTAESVQEAIEGRADLVISHHPLPFRPLKKITTSELTGRLLWQLASAGISVYCPHTAWDSAAFGINTMLAERLKLQSVRPMIPEPERESTAEVLGTGRLGELPTALTLTTVAKLLCESVPYCRPRAVATGAEIRRVGIVCGSGASLLESAVKLRCDLFLTGEATFHQCLEAKAAGMSMLMIGHFASEKFAMDRLAEVCGTEFAELQVWGSRSEQDPVGLV